MNISGKAKREKMRRKLATFLRRIEDFGGKLTTRDGVVVYAQVGEAAAIGNQVRSKKNFGATLG